jgi:DNA-binding MarR family transcriptional regulator
MNDVQNTPATADARAERLLRLIHWSSAASRQLRRHLAEAAAPFDLSDSELLVVWLCRDADRVQVELAAAIGVSQAQMSGVVERLRSRGLVAMHRPTIDRRRQVWRARAAGLDLLARIAPGLEELARSLEEAVAADAQQTAETLCIQLANATGSGRGSNSSAGTGNQDGQHACKEAA